MKRKKWTEEDDELVMSGADFHVVAQILDRTYCAVQVRFYKLEGGCPINKPRVNGWTEDDLLKLEMLTQEGLTAAKIGEKIGRTVNAIYNCRKMLKRESSAAVEEVPNPYDYGFTLKEDQDPDDYWNKCMGVAA